MGDIESFVSDLKVNPEFLKFCREHNYNPSHCINFVCKITKDDVDNLLSDGYLQLQIFLSLK